MKRNEEQKRCDIIIPVWNLPDITRECLESLLKKTWYPHRLIVVDNGSETRTKEYLEYLKSSIPGMILLRNDDNKGFVKAVNQGIAVSHSRFLCILNNDTLLTEGWLRELVWVMEQNPHIGLLNPSSNTSGQFPGNDPIDAYAASLSRFKGMVQELYNARGFCMLIRREVIEKLGPLDEIYHMGYFDDTDYCKRAQRLGFRTARAKASYVYHRENQSFALRKDNETLFKKNEEIFFSRWGRHLRVGYFIDNVRTDTLRKKIDELATDVARSGHQISIFLKRGAVWPVSLDHFDIRRNDVNALLYGSVSLYKILKRKRKKGFHVLLTEDGLFGAVLKLTRFLHKADVIVKPRRRSVLRILEDKSKTRG